MGRSMNYLSPWRIPYMLKNRFLAAVALLFCVSCSVGAEEGASGAQFLRIGPAAMVSSLGEAGAVVTGAQSVFYNPAGLSGVGGTEVSVSHVKWIMELGYSSLAAAKRIGGGVYALSVNYLAIPAISKYDRYGSKLSDSYSASDKAVTAAYARSISDRTSVGFGLKYISCTLDSDSASAFAADAGVRYEALPGTLVFGASVQNAGTTLKYQSQGDPLPLNLKAGGRYIFKMEEERDLKKSVAVLADVNQLRDTGVYANLGLDFSAIYANNSAFSLRAGYKADAADSGGGLSFGLGMDMETYSIDYAYSPMGDLGQAHRMSFNLKFGAAG